MKGQLLYIYMLFRFGVVFILCLELLSSQCIQANKLTGLIKDMARKYIDDNLFVVKKNHLMLSSLSNNKREYVPRLMHYFLPAM